MEKESGLLTGEQIVMYRGKVLQPADRLVPLGIAYGDTLNVIKGRMKDLAPKSAAKEEEEQEEGPRGSNAVRLDMMGYDGMGS